MFFQMKDEARGLNVTFVRTPEPFESPPPTPPPELGQHSSANLSEAGFSASEIDAL
jgi:crotonobetainyl-CoA:carnitine CoA-transferase CaiB-like acyl-CoA transferase